VSWASKARSTAGPGSDADKPELAIAGGGSGTHPVGVMARSWHVPRVLPKQSSAQAGRGQVGRTGSGGRGTSTVSGRTARPLAEAVCGVLRALRGAVTSVQSVLLVAFSPRVQESLGAGLEA